MKVTVIWYSASSYFYDRGIHRLLFINFRQTGRFVKDEPYCPIATEILSD